MMQSTCCGAVSFAACIMNFFACSSRSDIFVQSSHASKAMGTSSVDRSGDTHCEGNALMSVSCAKSRLTSSSSWRVRPEWPEPELLSNCTSWRAEI